VQVLIAPDSYGDSLTAVEAAEAIARGWRRGRPDDELILAPQSDGGPGFVGVLAGRISAGLLALGGHHKSGAAIIAEHTRLADDVGAAQRVITGDGRFDDQSLHGKVVSALAAGARSHHIPVLVLAGQVTLAESTRREAGIAAAFSITDHAGSVQRAIDDAANQLEGLAEVTAATWG
jgi:glycerate 2-kinase